MKVDINLVRRIIRESVKAVLFEDDSDRQREIDSAWAERDAENADRKKKEIERMYQMGKKRPDFNTKKVERWFKADGKWNPLSYYRYEDDGEEEEDKIAKEFLNRPNAARDFVHFPRQSVQRQTDFDSLRNGSKKLKALKTDLERRTKNAETDTMRSELWHDRDMFSKFCDYLKKHNFDESIFTDENIAFIKGIVKKNLYFYHNDLLKLYIDSSYETDNWFDALKSFALRSCCSYDEVEEMEAKFDELYEKLVDAEKI